MWERPAWWETDTVKASLNNGRDMVAIPGPSVTPDRVLAAMHRPMPNIYAGELLDITDEIFEQLPGIARTSATPFVTVSNGHGAWEMSISNTLSRGDRVLVLESGRFAVVWGEMAAVSGVEIETVHAADRSPIDPADVEARLRADTDRSIKAVFAVHVDTSTSVRNDIAAIRRAIDAADHPALLMVDCIASLGCDRYPHGRVGRRRHGRRLAEGSDGAARSRLRVGRTEGVGGARARRVAFRLLGLDAPLAGRSALPALLRHPAGVAHVRPPRGAGDDPRGDARLRVGSPRDARPIGARRGRRVVGAGRARAPHRRSRRPIERGHDDPHRRHRRRPRCATSARNAPASRSASAWRRTSTCRSASVTWATSTRRCCSARSARSKPR